MMISGGGTTNATSSRFYGSSFIMSNNSTTTMLNNNNNNKSEQEPRSTSASSECVPPMSEPPEAAPLGGTKAEATQRLQVGLFGLGSMVLLVHRNFRTALGGRIRVVAAEWVPFDKGFLLFGILVAFV